MSFKLICLDMDGVLLKDVNFWLELHKKFGTFEEGKVLTEKYLTLPNPEGSRLLRRASSA